LAQLVLYLPYVTVGRGGTGVQERQAVVRAGEAVDGVHVAVTAHAEGSLIDATEHACLGRLARGAYHLHRPDEAAGTTMHSLIRMVRRRKKHVGGMPEWIGRSSRVLDGVILLHI
jgi:dihydroorotase-like cyclic amidohydrolase